MRCAPRSAARMTNIVKLCDVTGVFLKLKGTEIACVPVDGERALEREGITPRWGEKRAYAIKLSGPPYGATREGIEGKRSVVAVAKVYLRQNKGARLGADVTPVPPPPADSSRSARAYGG